MITLDLVRMNVSSFVEDFA